jgi:hypothetical protein
MYCAAPPLVYAVPLPHVAPMPKPVVYAGLSTSGLSTSASDVILRNLTMHGLENPHAKPYVTILDFIAKGQLVPTDLAKLETILADENYAALSRFVNEKRAELLATAISTPIWKLLFGVLGASMFFMGGVWSGGVYLWPILLMSVGYLGKVLMTCGTYLPFLIIVVFLVCMTFFHIFRFSLWNLVKAVWGLIKAVWGWIGRTFFSPSVAEKPSADTKTTECVVDCEVINEIASLFSHFGNVEALKLALSMMLGGMIAMNSSMTMLDPVTNLSVPLFPALPSQLTQRIFTAGNMSNLTSYGRAKFDFGDLPETKFQRMVRERMEKDHARVEDAAGRHWIHAYANTFAISLSAFAAFEGGKIAAAALYARRLAYLARLAAAELTMQAAVVAQAQVLNAAVGAVGLANARVHNGAA